MAWRQRGVVVVRSPIGRASTVGRESDNNVTERPRAKAKCAIVHVGVVFRGTPCRLHALDGLSGKRPNEIPIAIEREDRLARRLKQRIEQRTRGGWRPGDRVIHRFHVRQQGKHARRNVEADGISASTQHARIIR